MSYSERQTSAPGRTTVPLLAHNERMAMKNRCLPSWLLVGAVTAVFGAHVPLANAGMPSAADVKLTTVVDIATVAGEITGLYEPKSQTAILIFSQGLVDGSRIQPRVFMGTTTLLFEQALYGYSVDTKFLLWGVHAPRARPMGVAHIHALDGKYSLICDEDSAIASLPLTSMTAVELAALRNAATFRSSALVHTPVALARDEAGVYYYVDGLRKEFGGEGFRVYVGKRGALKLMPLRDVAVDAAGMVLATKNGDLQLTVDADAPASATWKNRGKVRQLKRLDPFMNSYLIHRELGVYAGFGTACDDQ